MQDLEAIVHRASVANVEELGMGYCNSGYLNPCMYCSFLILCMVMISYVYKWECVCCRNRIRPHHLHPSQRPVLFHLQKGQSIVSVGRSLDEYYICHIWHSCLCCVVLLPSKIQSESFLICLFGPLTSFSLRLALKRSSPQMRWRPWSYKWVRSWTPL